MQTGARILRRFLFEIGGIDVIDKG